MRDFSFGYSQIHIIKPRTSSRIFYIDHQEQEEGQRRFNTRHGEKPRAIKRGGG